MDVIVIVAVRVIVAALVNGNDIVNVIDIVNDQGSTSFVCMATMRSSNSIVHGVDHGHGIVPDHERGHDHARDHAHGHGHATATFTSRVLIFRS